MKTNNPSHPGLFERAGQSKARFWVNLQANDDLWQATQREHPDVIKLEAVA